MTRIEVTADDRPSAEGVAKYEALRKAKDQTHLCNAPVTNLYFRTDGLVVPCWLQIGDAVTNRWSPDRSIRDIWDSEYLGRLRADLRDGRMGGMCWLCKNCVDEGTRPLALAYEDVEPNPGYEWPSMIELELSNQCNLECVMCQGSLSHLIRRNREHLPPLPQAYDDSFVDQLREFIPHLQELRFNGGEPLVQSQVFDICELVYELNPGLKITIATNGNVLNDRVRSHFERGNFHVNISIDSLRPERYEAIRPRSDHAQLIDNFFWFRDYCDERNRLISVQVNPMRHNWDEMGEIMDWALKNDTRCWYNIVRYPLGSALWNLPADDLEEIHRRWAAIEFVHDHHGCVVTQREIGVDTASFAAGLKSALRQAPDVILIGEMRDLETVEAAIHFSETGHLVLGTLHANNANQSVERLMNFFAAELHEQVYAQLALNLRGIVSQRLVPKASGEGRVAAIEVMLNTPRVADLIAKGEIASIKGAIEANALDGSQSFDMALYELYRAGLISLDEALRQADSANNLRLRIKMAGEAPGAANANAAPGEAKAAFSIKRDDPDAFAA